MDGERAGGVKLAAEWDQFKNALKENRNKTGGRKESFKGKWKCL